MILSNISGFAVRNWQFTLVVFAMLAAIGFNAFNTIPRAEDPELKGPFAVINVALPGADPADIEKLVIRPIEDAVNRLDDLKELESRAEDGLAVITVEFDWSTDPDKKYDDVVREINALRPSLPSGIRRLDINKFRTSLTNIVQIALVSETAPNRVLEDLADDLTDELYRVPGVRDAEVWALPQSEVRVALDFGRLAALAIPVTAVANAVGADSTELPGGPIHSGARRFNLKTAGGYDDLEEIRNTVVGNFGGNFVRVRDVADVSWVVPTVQLMDATAAVGTQLHSWQMVAQGKSGPAAKGMIHAAQVMAMTGVDVVLDAGLRERAWADLRARGGAEGYICPLTADAVPPVKAMAAE